MPADLQRELFEPGIEARFEQFVIEAPELYDFLVARAREMRARGFSRYGIKSLYEVARFHFSMTRKPGEEYKLNNDYTALFARKIMRDHPDLDGFFETRRLRS